MACPPGLIVGFWHLPTFFAAPPALSLFVTFCLYVWHDALLLLISVLISDDD